MKFALEPNLQWTKYKYICERGEKRITGEEYVILTGEEHWYIS